MIKRVKSLSSQFFLSSVLSATVFGGMVHAQTSVTSVVPSGTVARADFVRVTFIEEVIELGADSVDPFVVECDKGPIAGSAKWPDNRTWQYDFATALTEPQDCVIRSNPEFADLNGVSLNESKYSFKTGNLTVDARPWPSSSEISEDQYFILAFNGAIANSQLEQHGYCAVDGVGERLPLKVLDASEVSDYLETVWFSADTDWTKVVHCGRRLPTGADMSVVLEGALSTEFGHELGKAKRFEYTVREPFAGTISCQRLRQGAPCMPLSDIKIGFNALVDTNKLKQIQLRVNGELQKPDSAGDTNDYEVNIADEVVFKGPFPEEAALAVLIPQDFHDDLERELANSTELAQEFTLDEFPPLAKFAKQEFGIYEIFESSNGVEAVIPVTQRRLALDKKLASNYLKSLSVTDDAEVIRWMQRFSRLDETTVDTVAIKDIMADKSKVQWGDYQTPDIDTRSISIFAETQEGLSKTQLPPMELIEGGDAEIVGIPLAQSGFHVLELQSPTLGSALLENNDLMHVRTTALVTNLAVHFKYSMDDLLVWVTRLDTGKPVADANIKISDCKAKPLHSGKTDKDGRLYIKQTIERTDDCYYSRIGDFFVSATIDSEHPDALGVNQYSFALSNWNRGIEPWRFNISNFLRSKSDIGRLVEHSFFDRPLYQPGQIVAMKHYLRVLDKRNLSLPRASELPDKVRITHSGSGDQYDFNIQWLSTPSGGLSATTYWTLPKSAKLGRYRLSYLRNGNEILDSDQSFRVEEFKIPFLTGSMQLGETTKKPSDSEQKQKQILVAPQSVALDLQLNYISGGAASNWDTEVSAMIGEAVPSFEEYADYQFASKVLEDNELISDDESPADKVFLKQKALAVDEEGRGHLLIDSIPNINTVSRLRVENGFMDPNGELQTLQQSVVLWPADLAIGMQLESYDEGDVSANIDLLLLNAAGEPLVNHPVTVSALQEHYFAIRKRLVGGFYRYDSEQKTEELGQVCDGQTDEEGKFSCEINEQFKGDIIFQAVAEDEQGRRVSNSNSAYFSGWGWLGSADHDRIDIVADKKSYAPNETAILQVRMPFQKATALVAIERAGIMETQVHELSAEDPNIRLEIDNEWYPNVYVSVLAVRGRVNHEDESEQPSRVTGLIDLNKPSFRYGLTELKVNDPDKQFTLELELDKENYQLRETASLKIKGVLQDGTPASRASVALAVVDEALLELATNNSANIINAMRRERGYGVTTATAQSEVVGRRHYGRKAVAAGGGAADLSKSGGSRELFDTLLLWNPTVALDSNGEATIPILLNDSISRFKVIAVGDYGVDRFAEAKTEFTSSKDLQLISGIPSLVREQDNYDLSLTLRNTTDRDLSIIMGGNSSGALTLKLKNQAVSLGAKQSKTITWPVALEEMGARNFAEYFEDKDKETINWQFFAIERTAKDSDDEALKDSIKISQKIQPLIPITVRQSTMLPLEADAETSTVRVGLADNALSSDGLAVGGVTVQLQNSLLGQSDELIKWFNNYPYTCYEQLAAVAVGLDDRSAWDSLMLELPQYLDSQGLVKYFPSARLKGSSNLTAYLLSLSLHAKRIGLDFEIPQAHKERMLSGLVAAFEGRIDTQVSNKQWRWSYRLAALTTLAEYGQVTARTAAAYFEQYDAWSMSDWINWLIIANGFNDAAMDEIGKTAKANLLSLLSREGQLLVPQSNDMTNTWWTMFSRQANLAKLLFVVADDERWSADIPYLLNGLLSLQSNGHWGTTVANTYGKLAMNHYAMVHEGTQPIGELDVSLLSGEASEGAITRIHTDITTELFEDHQVLKLAPMPWADKVDNQLHMDFAGEGKLWATVSAHAAVPLLEPRYAGYKLERKVIAVTQKTPGQWTQGDVYRVQIKVHANSPMTWVVVNDPIPSGATILGSGLGRDSVILQEQSAQVAAANKTDDDNVSYWRSWPAFVERGTDSYRAYYDYMSQGETEIEYTVRLNHSGEFNLPPTRVEALYNPDVYGEWPNNESFKVQSK